MATQAQPWPRSTPGLTVPRPGLTVPSPHSTPTALTHATSAPDILKITQLETAMIIEIK